MFIQRLAARLSPFFASPVQRTIAERLDVIEDQIGFADFNLDSFRDWIAHLNQRAILCEPLAMHPAYSGAWVRTPVVDIIFYEERTTPLHQAHIQLHELCHILCLHDTFTVHTTRELELVRDTLMHGAVTPLFADALRLRSARTSVEEQEAEGLATQLHQRVLRAQVRPATDFPVTSSDALRRMYKSMGWV